MTLCFYSSKLILSKDWSMEVEESGSSEGMGLTPEDHFFMYEFIFASKLDPVLDVFLSFCEDICCEIFLLISDILEANCVCAAVSAEYP